MWIFVKLPNSVSLEVELDGNSVGQECLDKVCQLLGILETDYFSLQCTNSKNEKYWLNMRNPIRKQLTAASPHKMKLRVKFFVAPHNLLHEKTRWLFQITLLEDFVNGSRNFPSEEQAIEVAGLLAQAEHGDRKTNLSPCHHILYSRLVPASLLVENKAEAFLDAVAMEHSKHRGMPRTAAVNKTLITMSLWADYGVEYHIATVPNTNTVVSIGVGPHGVSIFNSEQEELEKLTYDSIAKVTTSGRSFYIHTLNDAGESVNKSYFLPNRRAANNLYRCVTEMYLFFKCDKVKYEVQSQVAMDIKGFLASLFNENTELGKKYVFDIRRTQQEAVDYYRRQLYKQDQDSTGAGGGSRGDQCASCLAAQGEECDGVCAQGSEATEQEVATQKNLELQLRELEDMFRCRICMSANIGTAIFPCGHAVCCKDCCDKLKDACKSCPMCRGKIEIVKEIFLPTSDASHPEKKARDMLKN